MTSPSSPPLPGMQPEHCTALRLETPHLQRFNQATVQSQTGSHIYLRHKQTQFITVLGPAFLARMQEVQYTFSKLLTMQYL